MTASAVTRGAPTGATLFAGYAYPPNELGYCGPPESTDLLQLGAGGGDAGDLARLAKGFEGTWPYLEFIARHTGIEDPLDVRVIEAYWLGTDLIGDLDLTVHGAELLDRLRHAGAVWARFPAGLPEGAVPDHTFHVFGVYPWAGMLDTVPTDDPRRILDRCRIRWGRVITDEGDSAIVESTLLTWDGERLGLGDPQPETVRTADDGLGFTGRLEPGEWVAMHWDWVCARLEPDQLVALERSTQRHLAIVNERFSPRPET